MTLKEILDKLTELARFVQYADESKDKIVRQVEEVMMLVGQVLAQKELHNEELQRLLSNIWVSHIKGNFDCPHCNKNVLLDFFIGAKGLDTKPLISTDKQQLISQLSFPPITMKDLETTPIPDFIPPTL
jgi:hypothetical protein